MTGQWRAIEGGGVWFYEDDGFDPAEFRPWYDETFGTWDEAQKAIKERLEKRWRSEDCADCAHAASSAHLDLSRLWFRRRDEHVEPPDVWTWNIDGADWVILRSSPEQQ